MSQMRTIYGCLLAIYIQSIDRDRSALQSHPQNPRRIKVFFMYSLKFDQIEH